MLDLARRWTDLDCPTRVFVVQQVTDNDVLASVPESVQFLTGTERPSRLRAALLPAATRLLMAARQSDVVISGSEIGFGLLLGSWAARIARRPFVVSVHGHIEASIRQWVPGYLQGANRRAISRSRVAVCASADLVPDVLRLHVQRQRVFVVPNGIDSEAVRQLSRESGSLVRAGVPTVVAVGRLAHEKGFELLIEAHARVLGTGMVHDLLILGEGAHRQALERLVRECEVVGTVRLPGFCRNPLPSVADATLFCLSSHREGLPVALLEAAALRTPILATRASEAVIELLGHGLYGELVPTGSVATLADALGRHLSSPDQLQALAAKSAQHIRRYETAVTSRRYLAAVAQACKPITSPT